MVLLFCCWFDSWLWINWVCLLTYLSLPLQASVSFIYINIHKHIYIYKLTHIYIFSFVSHTCNIWKLLGQGLKPSHICILHHSYGNEGSLTHCTGPGMEHATEMNQIINPLCHSGNSSLFLNESNRLGISKSLSALKFCDSNGDCGYVEAYCVVYFDYQYVTVNKIPTIWTTTYDHEF